MQINKSFLTHEFESFLDSLSENSNSTANNKLVSFSFEIPSIEISTLINSNIAIRDDLFYWKIKNEDLEFLASGSLVNLNEYGEDRLAKTSEKINSIAQNCVSNWERNNLTSIPHVVGGIKFSPNQKSETWSDFSDSDWFIPKLLFYSNNNRTFLIYNFFLGSGQEHDLNRFEELINQLHSISYETVESSVDIGMQTPFYTNSYDSWENIVNKALVNISNGLLSKVVLSRQVVLKLMHKPVISELLKKLSENYPNCYTFAYRRNSSIYFGASPEKLAKISDKWIEVDALAGSAPRGKSDIEDIKMENALLSSKKNLFEQRAVVNFIHNLLRKFSDEIIFDDKPIIRKLPNIQHLWTIIKAKVNNNFKMFDLMVKLHPTPAICGDPWKIAQDFILEMEPHDRGLYSGNIGWFNFDGSGEFAVGIRTALIKNNELFAYAGCGIVEGSEANAEFEESEIKLKPILSLFIDEKVYQS